MAKPTDAELIARSLSDGNTFEEIFRRHFDAVYTFLVRRYGPRVADEVASEVFQVAWRQRRSYDRARANSRPWLYGIADNLAKAELRRLARQEQARARASSEPPNPETHFDAVDDRLHAAWASPRVAGAINALSQGERDVLLLFVWSGRSYFEISVELDIAMGTVRSRMNSSRQKIQEAVSDGEAPPNPKSPRGNLR